MLIEKAERIAAEVAETGRKFFFSNLNSYERFIIHSFLAESDFKDQIETYSQDSYSGRVLVIDVKK